MNFIDENFLVNSIAYGCVFPDVQNLEHWGKEVGKKDWKSKSCQLVTDALIDCSDGGQRNHGMSVLQSQVVVLWQGSLNTRGNSRRPERPLKTSHEFKFYCM